MNLLFLFLTSLALADSKCECKCVVKDDDGKFVVISASGRDRERAGEALKKALKKSKCEISPECEGKCALD